MVDCVEVHGTVHVVAFVASHHILPGVNVVEGVVHQIMALAPSDVEILVECSSWVLRNVMKEAVHEVVHDVDAVDDEVQEEVVAGYKQVCIDPAMADDDGRNDVLGLVVHVCT